MTSQEMLIAAVVSLAGAIAFLFKTSRSQSEKQNSTSERLGYLEGRANGIEELSKKTLNVVHSAIAEQDPLPTCNYPKEDTNEDRRP